MDKAMTALAAPLLDSFSEDLAALSRAGYLPLTVARDKEFEEIFTGTFLSWNEESLKGVIKSRESS